MGPGVAWVGQAPAQVVQGSFVVALCCQNDGQHLFGVRSNMARVHAQRCLRGGLSNRHVTQVEVADGAEIPDLRRACRNQLQCVVSCIHHILPLLLDGGYSDAMCSYGGVYFGSAAAAF